MKTYWVYILRCENETLYTGYTDDLLKRYQVHKNGAGSKYTRSFKPKLIAQCWEVSGGKGLAMQVEHQIKKMSREEKERVILNPKIVGDNEEIRPGIVPNII